LILWDSLEEKIKNTYLENNILPEQRSKNKAQKIQQIDYITKKVVKIHLSKSDVTRDCQISRKTIDKITNNNSVYNGFLWKIM
jgi:hypothetical protein